MGTLLSWVTSEQVAVWLVIAFFVAYFIYKEWPAFRDRVSSGAVKKEKDSEAGKTVEERLGSIENRLTTIEEKLGRDYTRLGDIEREHGKTRKMAQDSLEEREIIMKTLLGVLGGLQELGANGPTKEAEAEIRNYLNRKAHDD